MTLTLQGRRKAAGLSQDGLAYKSGIPAATIRDYEQGRRDINGMGIKRAAALAAALGCRIEDLIEGESEPE
ncbi:MAG: helix-turn-helix transcriptional regulator [Clostridiales Family XIII bacterium]|jgi:transcriptional regulator with XRE-family HTH domain|nr:helix-turn-helix transcriptional regulator [Clostridiales Family XIII bacterium]